MNPNIIPLHTHSAECRLVKAQVKSASKNSILIDTEIGVVNARAAFSCLVAPEVGDTVLVNHAAGEYYVLAILERPDKQNMTLTFPADVKLQALAGKVDMLTSQGINLSSAADAHISSAKLHMTSSEMNVNTGKLTSMAKEIESHSDTANLYARTLNTVAKQISQKTDVLVRWVENVETLNIGNLIQNIRKNYTSHSEQVIVTAAKDMHLDAERIHMG